MIFVFLDSHSDNNIRKNSLKDNFSSDINSLSLSTNYIKFNKCIKKIGQDSFNKTIKYIYLKIIRVLVFILILFLFQFNNFFILVNDLIKNQPSTSKEDAVDILDRALISLDDLGKFLNLTNKFLIFNKI